MLEFGILGPVEVQLDGRRLNLGGPKQRALLACLLLHANEVVSRDRLLAAMWGERPPPTASRSLDSYISRLRSLVGADRVIRRAPGHLLVVEAGELDLDRFESLAGESRLRLVAGDWAGAASGFRGALGLWRGPALADLVYEPIGGDGHAIEERRLATLEDCLDAELALGLAAERVSELALLAQEHPLRERLLGQLMLALYRAGRQAEALAVFESARRRLAGELGLEPGPRLRELERQILRHAPELSPPAVPHRFRAAGGRRLAAVAATAVAATALAAAVGLFAHDDGVRRPRPEGASTLLMLGSGSGAVEHADDLAAPPSAIAVGNGAVWVADSSDRQVLRVDPGTRRIVDRIPVEGQPSGIVLHHGAIWVASTLTGTVSRIEAATDAVTQTIRLGGADAAAVASGPSGLWVADSTDHALVQIDETTGVAVRTITLDLRPTALAVARGTLWAADHDSGKIAQVDVRTGETVGTYQAGGGPVALALGRGSVWIANSLDATVSRIDQASGAVLATIPVGSGPSGITIAGGSVWVADQYGGAVSRIDPRSNAVTRTVEAAGQPSALAARRGVVWIGSGPDASLHRGGTLTIASTARFASIDPAFQNLAPPDQFGKLAYDTLVTFQASTGSAGLRLVPDLAVGLPVATNGGRTYAFRLRRGIRYSDGRPLRAGDFRRAIERLFRVGSQGAAYYSGVVGSRECLRRPEHCDLSRGIRVDDAAGTVVFELVSPDPDFLYKLTPYSYSVPIPSGTPYSDVGAAAVPGTGPYRILPWYGGGVRFVRNPYFREWSHAAQPAGNPDAIEWRIYPSLDAMTRAVERGSADWVYGLLAPRQVRRLELELPGQLHANPAFYVEFVPLNTHRPPFDDVRVRQALNLAIDRARIVSMYGGPIVATPTCQPLPPGLLGYRRYCPYTLTAGPGGAWRAPDLARARRLVAASGTAGLRVDVWGPTDAVATPRGLPAYIASVLRSLGYRTKLHLLPIEKITYRMRRSFQISVDGDWSPDYPTPSAMLPQFFGCDGGYSNGYVCDPALDRMMERANTLQLQAPTQVAALWAKVDRAIVDQAYWVPTVIAHPPELVSKRLRNFEYNEVWDFLADQAWLR